MLITQRHVADAVDAFSRSGAFDRHGAKCATIAVSNVRLSKVRPSASTSVHAGHVFDLAAHLHAVFLRTMCAWVDVKASQSFEHHGMQGDLDAMELRSQSGHGTTQASDVGNMPISIDVWFQFISQRLAIQQQRPLAQVQEAFRVLDQGCKGYVTRQQWLDAIAKHAPHLNRQASDDAFAGLTGGGDAALTCERFCAIMTETSLQT